MVGLRGLRSLMNQKWLIWWIKKLTMLSRRNRMADWHAFHSVGVNSMFRSPSSSGVISETVVYGFVYTKWIGMVWMSGFMYQQNLLDTNGEITWWPCTASLSYTGNCLYSTEQAYICRIAIVERTVLTWASQQSLDISIWLKHIWHVKAAWFIWWCS